MPVVRQGHYRRTAGTAETDEGSVTQPMVSLEPDLSGKIEHVEAGDVVLEKWG